MSAKNYIIKVYLLILIYFLQSSLIYCFFNQRIFEMIKGSNLLKAKAAILKNIVNFLQCDHQINKLFTISY